MEELIVQKNMDLEKKTIATLKNAPSMVSGVSGQLVLNHVVDVGRREVVQIQRLHMEELIVQKNMDLEKKTIATLKNAPSMVSGVSGQLVLKHVMEVGRREVVQIQRRHMEELIVKLDMDLEKETIATLKIVPLATTKWDAQESCGEKYFQNSKCLVV